MNKFKALIAAILTAATFASCGNEAEKELFAGEYISIDNCSVFDRITCDSAVDCAYNALNSTGIMPENASFMCAGAAENETGSFHVIDIVENGETAVVTLGVVWVNTEDEAVYLRFDPTLDSYGYFSEYGKDIPEDDGRTRLIKLS